MRLLIVGADNAVALLARRGLPRDWAVEVAGVGAAPPAADLAATIERTRPDVIYSPSIVAAGLAIAAARSAVSAPFPAWLSGISAFDLMADYQEPATAERVSDALKVIDGIMPCSARVAAAAAATGCAARLIEVMAPAPALDFDTASGNGWRPAPGPAIVVDGSQGVVERGQVALAALRARAHDLAGRRIVVLSAGPDVALAATVLAADTGLPIATMGPAESSPMSVWRAHSHARVSIHLSLAADITWGEMAALARGAVPVVSASSALVLDSHMDADTVAVLADPEDPRAVGEAVCRVLADDALSERARALNPVTARERFNGNTAAASLWTAVIGLVGDR